MNQNSKTVLVFGATGMVGKELVSQLDQDQSIEKIICIVRRPVAFKEKKVTVEVVDFMNMDQHKDVFESVHSVFCCIGTTMKVAGSREAFQIVDHYMPISVARTAKEVGVQSFSLVSSVSAYHKSKNFYLKVKGRVEQDLKKIAFDRLIIYRPALLAGDRKPFRFGEFTLTIFFRLFSIFVPKKFRIIHAKDLSNEMVRGFNDLGDGVHIIERDMIS